MPDPSELHRLVTTLRHITQVPPPEAAPTPRVVRRAMSPHRARQLLNAIALGSWLALAYVAGWVSHILWLR